MNFAHPAPAPLFPGEAPKPVANALPDSPSP